MFFSTWSSKKESSRFRLCWSVEQLIYVFQRDSNRPDLAKKPAGWGAPVAIDGSLIDAVLSMAWADYRQGAQKAEVHVGFDLNHSIPAKIFLTDGKGDK